LERMDCAAVTASLPEAQMLSRLLNRSADLLPHPVSSVFFEVAIQEDMRPSVVADGVGEGAFDVVARLSVLLNSRNARVPIAWLGLAEPSMRAQLEAASVRVLDIPDEAERAQALACASAFIHISVDHRLPLAVAQAMAAGVPCLVSDTPSHRALIRHGETGFICTSERDFLEKLVLLLRDRQERSRIGEAARADAQRCFTLRHFERAVLRAYRFSTASAPHAARPSTTRVNHVS
jgi:glycosyltransferase involved in cell wall biosynthesis